MLTLIAIVTTTNGTLDKVLATAFAVIIAPKFFSGVSGILEGWEHMGNRDHIQAKDKIMHGGMLAGGTVLMAGGAFILPSLGLMR